MEVRKRAIAPALVGPYRKKHRTTIPGVAARRPETTQLLIVTELTYQPPGACVTSIS
jgi:hypothetical protein